MKDAHNSSPIRLNSPAFYAACGVGGILACGPTHMAVTPMDVIKVNMQIDPAKYSTSTTGLKLILKEQGIPGLLRGWSPTLIGYSAQGFCKYGFYEYFKNLYSSIAGPSIASDYKTPIYLAASASAEFIADVALCPFEAVKVKIQAQPGFATGLSDGLARAIREDGLKGLYRGIGPLWARQVPYTMMKFATFENTVDAIYKHAVPVPKEECSSGFQLGISFAGGYIAGIACAVISHPADNLVSLLNSSSGDSIGVFDAVRRMGFVPLLIRGLPLRIAMVGSLTAAQWTIYDSFKLFVGLPTSGGSSNPLLHAA